MTDEQKEKKPGKPIGDFSTFGKKRPEVQNSESLEFWTSGNKESQTSSISDSRKSRHPDWKQKTVYLPPDLAKWLNIFAAQTEMEVSEVVAQALREYREKHT